MKPDLKNKAAKTGSEAEPASGSATMPLWLFVVLGIALWQGTLYLDRNGGGFTPLVYEPYPSLAFVKDLVPKDDSQVEFLLGQRVYSQACQACHQATGLGAPGQFPPLAGSEWVQAKGADRIIRLVLNGIGGPIEVKGQSFNGVMPPWRDTLKDEEIAAVITFIRGNKDWGNAASPVKAKDVAVIREETKARGTSWTPEELKGTPESK